MKLQAIDMGSVSGSNATVKPDPTSACPRALGAKVGRVWHYTSTFQSQEVTTRLVSATSVNGHVELHFQSTRNYPSEAAYLTEEFTSVCDENGYSIVSSKRHTTDSSGEVQELALIYDPPELWIPSQLSAGQQRSGTSRVQSVYNGSSYASTIDWAFEVGDTDEIKVLAGDYTSARLITYRLGRAAAFAAYYVDDVGMVETITSAAADTLEKVE